MFINLDIWILYLDSTSFECFFLKWKEEKMHSCIVSSTFSKADPMKKNSTNSEL